MTNDEFTYELFQFYKKLASQQVDMSPEESRIVSEQFWELLDDSNIEAEQ